MLRTSGGSSSRGVMAGLTSTCRPTSHSPGRPRRQSAGTSSIGRRSKPSGTSVSCFQKVQVWNSPCFSQRRRRPPMSR